MLRKLVRSCRAQSIVELALILPVLTLLLLGIMEGGRIFSAYVELQHVAREGARYAALKCTSIEVRDDQVSVWVTLTLVPLLESRLSTLAADDLAVSFVRSLSADGTEMWVELDVSYPLQIQTPLISDITGNPFNLQSKMVMRSE
jgi:Flp pilus assembly protein TadG